MSSYGFTDGQEITGWLGVPFEVGTGRVIGAGSYVAGPFACTNFASIIVAVKAIGGNVTVKLTQTVANGPASLQLVESVVVAAGGVLFEAFVLFGDSVTIEFDGSVGGTSIDYAIYPSNTTTNAQVITQATINVQHNDVLVGLEPTLDFQDANANVFTVTDDGPNTRVKVALPKLITGQVSGAGAKVAGTGYNVARTGAGLYTITYLVPFAAPPNVMVQPSSAFGLVANLTANAAGATSLELFTSAGVALTDGPFHFFAREVG